MNNSITEIEKIITSNLQTIAYLNNDVKEKEKEKHDLLKDLSLHIIDVLDSFERIEEKIIQKKYHEIEETAKAIKRYKTIEKKLLSTLENYGISKIQFPDNRLIVGLCEVVETEPDNTRTNDEIISIIRNGYIRGEEVIRPAQIIVVKN